MSLLGRAEECRALDNLLASVRAGRSGALVVRGEAGIGKTALIDYAVGSAADFLVVRITGLESERHLGFAALHRLLTPILHQIEGLPPPQQAALNSALGLAAGPPANGFLIGLGVTGLAANAVRARERLLCVIDDAQWIDHESFEALAFWGRRLQPEGVALIFGERDGSDAASLLDGIPVLPVGGLADDAARALLAARASYGLDRGVADRIVAETEGNPLAIVELAKDLTADQLVGAATVLHPLPLSRRLEERFARQVRSLPVDTQMLLLLAAADSTGDPVFLWRAASLLGIKREAAEHAEAAGLLDLESNVAFRHPLIRSAVYGGARPADRRAIHKTLAAATVAEADADRRAWHLAAASVGSDEEVAAILEGCARRVGGRGGHAAEVALLSRSAELTPDPERAAGRRVAAAEAALASGAPLQTRALIALATPELRNPTIRAKAERLEGCAWTRQGHVATAAPILLSAAVKLLGAEPSLGRLALLEALEAAFLSGNLAGHEVGRSAAAAAAGGLPPGEGTTVDALLDCFATYVLAGYVAAAPLLRSAVTALSQVDASSEQVIRWTVFASNATRALWDEEAHDEQMARLARLSRERGERYWLGMALQSRAAGQMWAGRFDAAEALRAEAGTVTPATGENSLFGEIMDLELQARRGREAEARTKARIVMSRAQEMGLGTAVDMAHLSLLVLDLGLGQYGDALGHAVAVFDGDPMPFGNQVLPDMVEAAIRAGDLAAATMALGRLAERAPASGTVWAMGLLARSRALMAAQDNEAQSAEAHFAEALELLGATRLSFELARAHLLYGEWLRRQKRRVDARRELRAAIDLFETMGAGAFAQRARDELLATGERARKRNVETSYDLTPQEQRVATLAAEGQTNAEIALQLFVGTSTVEYHLRKVFRKLSLTSRRQLKQALAVRGDGEEPASG